MSEKEKEEEMDLHEPDAWEGRKMKEGREEENMIAMEKVWDSHGVKLKTIWQPYWNAETLLRVW